MTNDEALRKIKQIVERALVPWGSNEDRQLYGQWLNEIGEIAAEALHEKLDLEGAN